MRTLLLVTLVFMLAACGGGGGGSSSGGGPSDGGGGPPLDTTAPTAALSADSASVVAGVVFSVTVLFSEDVTGLTEDDFNASNCTISGVSGSGAHYTVTVTAGNVAGSLSVELPAGAVADTASNALVQPRTIALTVTQEFGVTVITHGFILGGGLFSSTSWTLGMGRAVLNRAGSGRLWELVIDDTDAVGVGAIGQLYDRSAAWPGSYTVSDSGEQVIIVNWALTSDNTTPGFAEAAGHILYAILMGGGTGHAQPFITTLLNKPAHTNYTAPDQPLHFISHSFGTVVNSEAIQRLGYLSHIEVEQMTTLDPHDFDEAGIAVDGGALLPDVHCWDNVIIADNYYEETGPVVTNPTGRSVKGAQMIAVKDGMDLTNFDGFSNYVGVSPKPHSRVHTFYFGTIDLDATEDVGDGNGEPINNNWYRDETQIYSPARTEVGYAYARLGGRHYRSGHGDMVFNTYRSGMGTPIADSSKSNANGEADVGTDVPTWIFDGKRDAVLSGFLYAYGEVDARPGFPNKFNADDGGAAPAEHAKLGGSVGIFDYVFETNFNYMPVNARKLYISYARRNTDAAAQLNFSITTAGGSVTNYIGPVIDQIDSVWQTSYIDVSGFAGQSIRLHAELDDPSNSDPAEVWIDDLDLSVEADVPAIVGNG